MKQGALRGVGDLNRVIASGEVAVPGHEQMAARLQHTGTKAGRSGLGERQGKNQAAAHFELETLVMAHP